MGGSHDDLALACGILARDGLLLLSDAVLPSLAGLVAGEPIAGSWWGHPEGHAIFNLSGALGDHPDVATVKLVGGKVTFVHRRLWPALLGVATGRDAWQMDRLTALDRTLLDVVDRLGQVRRDAEELALDDRPAVKKSVVTLEKRLLVHVTSAHTEKGHHELVLESWARWASQVGAAPATGAAEGRALMESALARLNGGAGRGQVAKRAPGQPAPERSEGRAPALPWQARSRHA